MSKQTKLNIYFNISENSGVGYYRQYLHAVALKESGLANVLINDFTWGEIRLFCNRYNSDCKHVVFGSNVDLATQDFVKHLEEVHSKKSTDEEIQNYRQGAVDMIEPTMETLNNIGHWADVIIVGRRDSAEYLSQWKGLGQFFNIPIVWDTDDNVYATRPFNPGYRGYYPGSESLLWNKKTAQEVDAITVSTENLANVHAKDNKNIYIVPNALEFDRWAKSPKPIHAEVRIGLLVSASHHEDVKILEKVIPKILKKHKNAHFYMTNMFSYVFEQTLKDFPDQVHPIGWIALKDWPERVTGYGFDIGLAPLADNLFNRAKSNLRYLEYSAARMATIASPVEPYAKTIIEGKTGLFARNAEEWEQALDKLIKDSVYRAKLADNAYRLVGRKFDVYKNAPQTLKIYEQIVKVFRKAKGLPKFNLQDKVFKKAGKFLQLSAKN